MKAVLTSLGSMGDIQPMFALAVEMARAGHEITLCLSPNYAARAEALSLSFVPMGPDMVAGDVRSVIAEQTAMQTPAEQARLFIEKIGPHLVGMYRQLCDVCKDADVLISTPHQVAARMVHDAIGIPYVTVHLAHFGALGAKDLKAATAPIINGYRKEIGLEPLDDPLTADAASPMLALYAVSSRILKRPRNWPDHHVVTGWFFLDEENWDPPAELETFVESGEPPVVISFSSMMHEDAYSMTKLLVDAVRKADVRAVILDGWSGLGHGLDLPAGILSIKGFVPHHRLFPRAACVVHHGGAGTSAAVFRSGVPAVIVPHILDQPIWAEFARVLKCAGAVIPVRQLTSDKLADGIRSTLQSTEIRASAERMGADIATESGVQTARNMIENLIENRRGPSEP